ncbi:MAG: 30S ribosome-binding factor RbfA [Phycisphaerales bacterium]
MIGERRKKQIESILLRAIQERMARGVSDPRVRGLITVTKAEVTNDLKICKVFVTVLPVEQADLTVHGLRAAAKKLRRDVADKISMREMPSLDFRYDEGLKQQMEVMALLTKDKIERGVDPAETDAKDSADSDSLASGTTDQPVEDRP